MIKPRTLIYHPNELNQIHTPSPAEMRQVLGRSVYPGGLYAPPSQESRIAITPYEGFAPEFFRELNARGALTQEISQAEGLENSRDLAGAQLGELVRSGAMPSNWVESPYSGLSLSENQLGLSLRPKRSAPFLSPNPTSETNVSRVAKALERNDWSDPALQGPGAVENAREAFERGLITQGQYVTVTLRWGAFEDIPANGNDSPALTVLDAQGALSRESRELFGRPQPWYMENQRIGLNEDELAHFETLIKQLPDSERNFWVLRIPNKFLAQDVIEVELKNFPGIKQKRVVSRTPWGEAFKQLRFLILRQGFKVPKAHKRPGYTAFVLPSFGLMQAYLDARFGDEAVALLPSSGQTTPSQLMQGIRHEGRVLGLIAPNSKVKAEVAGGSSHIFFALHDLFHAYYGSLVPRQWRRLASTTFDALMAYKRARKAGQAPDRLLGEKFEDSGTLERIGDLFDFYRIPSDGFGKTFAQYYGKDALDKKRISVPYVSEGENGEKIFGSITKGYYGAATDTAVLVRDMVLNPSRWAGIDIEREVTAMGPYAKLLFKSLRLI